MKLVSFNETFLGLRQMLVHNIRVKLTLCILLVNIQFESYSQHVIMSGQQVVAVYPLGKNTI